MNPPKFDMLNVHNKLHTFQISTKWFCLTCGLSIIKTDFVYLNTINVFFSPKNPQYISHNAVLKHKPENKMAAPEPDLEEKAKKVDIN